ncbi:GNAT family N-acetyltransferase [Peptostreptococcus faecalis]|uniref:GNAT family N-acetyltransferase n=1 Tax=Peptostreptococcus faecalis TaxID=2045015 RepID=UPI000C7D086C|nr:GNAT family N-acetyltransferase [Peptostreptococcus faecalis]
MIRNLKKNDIDKIMGIWLTENIKAHSFILRSYWEDNYNFVKEVLPQADVFVYENIEGEIVGFLGLDNNYIAGIFVSGSEKSKGIGKNIIDYAKSIKDELCLKVYTKNTRAVGFYKREGFKIESNSIDDTTGEEELYMVWKSGKSNL